MMKTLITDIYLTKRVFLNFKTDIDKVSKSLGYIFKYIHSSEGEITLTSTAL
mgnify:CR=1 FL=1